VCGGVAKVYTLRMETNIQNGVSRVVVTETKTGIAIEGIQKPAHSLTDLLKDINKENLYAETDWGTAIGNEAW
jgi:antitoxin component of MazEF toxin-antitoxin module